MEHICHAAEVPGSPVSHTARRLLLQQGANMCDTQSKNTSCVWYIFLRICERYFEPMSRVHQGLFNYAITLELNTWQGLQVSAADAQLHTCGWDSLQTLGPEVWLLSPVWLTLGTSERHSTHCWWNYTYTNKSFLKIRLLQITFWKVLIASRLKHCVHVRCSAPSSAALKCLQMFALFNSCTQCHTFIYSLAL